ncbi:hypothetical protein Dimus_034859 [Dionaea muscipula]
MATAPAKSPLQDSPLTFPRWGSKTMINYQRCRRPVESALPPSPLPPPPPQPQVSADGKRQDRNRSPPSSDGDCGAVVRPELKNRKLTAGSRTAVSRNSFADMTQRRRMPTLEWEREKESLGQGDEVRVKSEVGEGESNAEGVDVVRVEAEAEPDESAQKPWNLRPRRAVTKAAIEIVAGDGSFGPGKNGEQQDAQQMENMPKSMRLRGFVEGGGAERKEKRRFWISLSREEIEEDIYALTGSKPARRPKKRARNAQKHLDCVFPGMWLAGVSPECYRVLDAPIKKLKL